MNKVSHRVLELRKLSKYRPNLLTGGISAIVICFLLCIMSVQIIAYDKQIATADSVQSTTNSSVPKKVKAASNQISLPAPIVAPRTITPVPACEPSKNNPPGPIQLSNAPDGLTKQIDTPQYYQIYGNDAATLRKQIRQCAPKSESGTTEFAAITSYQLTWQYNLMNTDNGLCKVGHAKVGIHVSQVLPLWQPSTEAQAGLAPKWQAFMGSLTTHENGHRDYDVQYAQMLLDDLIALPATPCAQLAQTVKHLTDSDVATLNQANDNYDSNTNHGATQGAILP